MGWMPRTSTADTSSTAAAPRKTVAEPVNASARPASAGPTSIEAVAMPPAATLAAVSSDGVREIEGRMAAWIGRVRVMEEAATAAPR